MTQPDFQPTLTGPPSQPAWRRVTGLSCSMPSDPEIGRIPAHRYTEPPSKSISQRGHQMAFVFVDRSTSRLIGSSRYYGYDAGRSEVEIGWTFIVRSHWGGATNREVKRLMLDHAFTFVDTVIFWVGEKNWRSQGAMTKIGGIRRSGLFTRELSGATPHFIFEIGKDRYLQGGRALVE
jgi:RimJ/RimL family protein N-acetyltransferase